MTRNPAANLAELPVELIQEILHFCCYAEDYFGGLSLPRFHLDWQHDLRGPLSSRQATLACVSRVCRRLRDITLPIFYQKMAFGGRIKAALLAEFLKTIELHPHRYPLIKELALVYISEIPDRDYTLISSIACFKKLERIQLHGVPFTGFLAKVDKQQELFPCLEYAEISYRNLSSTFIAFSTDELLPFWIAPKLKHFSLQFSKSHLCPTFPQPALDLPPVESLTFIRCLLTTNLIDRFLGIRSAQALYLRSTNTPRPSQRRNPLARRGQDSSVDDRQIGPGPIIDFRCFSGLQTLTCGLRHVCQMPFIFDLDNRSPPPPLYFPMPSGLKRFCIQITTWVTDSVSLYMLLESWIAKRSEYFPNIEHLQVQLLAAQDYPIRESIDSRCELKNSWWLQMTPEQDLDLDPNSFVTVLDGSHYLKLIESANFSLEIINL